MDPKEAVVVAVKCDYCEKLLETRVKKEGGIVYKVFKRTDDVYGYGYWVYCCVPCFKEREGSWV